MRDCRLASKEHVSFALPDDFGRSRCGANDTPARCEPVMTDGIQRSNSLQFARSLYSSLENCIANRKNVIAYARIPSVNTGEDIHIVPVGRVNAHAAVDGEERRRRAMALCEFAFTVVDDTVPPSATRSPADEAAADDFGSGAGQSIR